MTPTIAGYRCPCGTRYDLATESDREQYDQAVADHDAYCTMAQAGMSTTPEPPTPTMASTLALAADLVQDATLAGIEVQSVSAYAGGGRYASVRMFAVDNAHTQPLAVVIAGHGSPSTPRYVGHAIHRSTGSARYDETYTAEVDGVEVIVQGTVPAAVIETERAAATA